MSREIDEPLCASLLRANRLVNAAVGVIMARRGVDKDVAFRELAEHSRATGQKVAEVAAGYVADD